MILYVYMMLLLYFFSFSDTVIFFLDGMYIYSILILNINRHQLLSRIKSPLNSMKRTSTQHIQLSLIVTGILSVCHGIVVWMSDFLSSMGMTILYVLHFIVKEIPFVITVLLTSIVIIRLRTINGKNGYKTFLTKPSNLNEYPQSFILLRQLLLSLLLQIFFYVVPCICLLLSDVMIIYFNSEIQILEEFNLVCQLTDMILTPFALGILIEPRRGFLMSFWCMDTYPSEQNKKSPAKNSKLDAIDNELVKTCKMKRSDRQSETSCATNSTVLSRCNSLLDSPGTKKEGKHDLAGSEGDLSRYDIEKLISRRKSICKEGSIEIRMFCNSFDISLSNSASDLTQHTQGAKDIVESENGRRRSVSTVAIRRSSIVAVPPKDF